MSTLTLDGMLARKRAEINKTITARNAAAGELDALRGQSSPDAARIGQLRSEVASLDADYARLNGELESFEREAADDERIARAAEQRFPTNAGVEVRGGSTRDAGHVISQPEVYRRDDKSTSFFRDLHTSGRGDHAAAERLSRNNAANGMPERALSTGASAGGTFAPPGWLTDEYVAIARAHRVTADLLNKRELPGGISSLNLPKVSTGTGVGITQTQNTAITQTDITTTSVSSGITTISGGQTVSVELLRQSGIPLDDVILADLAAEYSRTLNVQVLYGTGADGQLKGFATNGTTVTYTHTSPLVVSTTAAASFYNRVISAANQVATTRFLPADAVIMHPRRWAWILTALDNDSRPLVVPTSSTNAPGISTEIVAEGSVGQFGGLPVYVDPSIATNLGAATNQDVAYVLRRDDLFLWETEVEALEFEATYAAQNSVFFRVLGFSAAIFDRHVGSLQKIDGTGMVAPAGI